MFELGPLLSKAFQALQAWVIGHGVPPLGAWILAKAIQVGVIVLLVSLVPMILVYAERKISAFMQARLGPMNVGPYGILQTLADGIKLIFKEDVIPVGSDRMVHILAPMVVVSPVFVCFAPIPFGKGLVPIDLDIGVLFIFAISGISTIGVLMAGWGSGNKFSMLGGLRGAAQLVSYEIPRVLSVVPVLMLYGTQSLRAIAARTAGTVAWRSSPMVHFLSRHRTAGVHYFPDRVGGGNQPHTIRYSRGGIRTGGRVSYGIFGFKVRPFLSRGIRVCLSFFRDGCRAFLWRRRWIYSRRMDSFLAMVSGKDVCHRFLVSLVSLDVPTTARGSTHAILLEIPFALVDP